MTIIIKNTYNIFILIFILAILIYMIIYINKNSVISKIHICKIINNMTKCFNRTKRVTCTRNSNRKYIIKRKRDTYKLLLNEHGHNNLNIEKYKVCNYLVIIIVEPIMFYERQIFRSIYKYYKDVVLVFCMGLSFNNGVNKKIMSEILKYNDIIQFYFFASYYSLILQTYNILLFSSKLNISFKWLIKHDSDTFFNINMLEHIHRSKSNCYINNSIFGLILNENNISFPSGMGYIIPYSKINDMIKASDPFINKDCYGPAEDVFIGKLANLTNIEMYDIRLMEKKVGEGGCTINNIGDYFMIHRLTPNEIFFLHAINNKNYIKGLCNLVE